MKSKATKKEAITRDLMQICIQLQNETKKRKKKILNSESWI